jgi:hypothetical protein
MATYCRQRKNIAALAVQGTKEIKFGDDFQMSRFIQPF